MHGPSVLLIIISGVLGVTSAAKYVRCEDQYCFVLVSDGSDFETAKFRCRMETYGTRLLDTADRELRGEAKKFLLYVTSMLNSTFSERVFINMKRVQTRDMKWYLLNSEEFEGDISRKDKANYGYLRFEKSGDSSRVDRYLAAGDHPTATKPFICEMDASQCSSAIADRFSYSKRCLVKDDRELPWFEARSSCFSRGGDLASIAYKADSGIPVDASSPGISKVLNKDPTGYWVGLRYQNMSWMSPSDSRHEQIAAGWSSRGGVNDPGFDCACADPLGNSSWSWTDCNCSAELPFICYANLTEFSYSTPSPEEGEECACNKSEEASKEEKDKEDKDNEERKQSEVLGIVLAVIISFVAAFLLAFILFRKS